MTTPNIQVPDAKDFSIRRALPDDLDDLVALERAAFALDAQSRRSLRWLTTRANADLRVMADAGGALKAYGLTLYRADSRVARLYSIAVAGDTRGCGLAARLLGDAVGLASTRGCTIMRAEARVSNTGSRALFAAAGFRETNRLPAYYPGPEDGVRMERMLERKTIDG